MRKYHVAHRPSMCQPFRIVSPDAMYQRPMPSVRANFRSAPTAMAQIRIVPKLAPATSEEIISPAPTPVTAMTMPGPTSLSLCPQVDGALPAADPVAFVTLVLPYLAPYRGVSDNNVPPEANQQRGRWRGS